jgi:hypothetical protein
MFAPLSYGSILRACSGNQQKKNSRPVAHRNRRSRAIVNCFPQSNCQLPEARLVWQTFATVANEIGFSILKYRERAPVLAVCTRCQLKFLTPSQLMRDCETATEYLWKKYSDHRCAAATAQDEETPHGTLPTLEADALRK